MSATQSWSGPSAEKSRFTSSSVALALASRFLVPALKRLCVTPSMPNSRVRRAASLRLTRSPPPRSAVIVTIENGVKRFYQQVDP